MTIDKNAVAKRMKHLDDLLVRARAHPNEAHAGTDASLPPGANRQAVAAAIIFRGGGEPLSLRFPAGQVTAPDAELHAIGIAVGRMGSMEDSVRMTIFTDSMAAANRALDPSVHSGQTHSLAVVRILSRWLSGDPRRTAHFVEVPSSFEWGPQRQAHDFARGLAVAMGRNPWRSLDFVRKQVTTRALSDWQTQFKESSSYRGKNFLELQSLDGEMLLPTYAKGGTWLPKIKGDTALFARATRCILSHAPLGEYYERFNIDAPHACRCGQFQTRRHLLQFCEECTLRPYRGLPRYYETLITFLEENPWAFSFADRPEPEAGGTPAPAAELEGIG